MNLQFNAWEDMYKYLTDGSDLYNINTGDYVFVYNDAAAICAYNLSSEKVQELVEMTNETGEYWGAFLGPGGNIFFNPDYDDNEHKYSEDKRMRDLYLEPAYDFCKDNYLLDGWMDVDEYVKVASESEKEPEEIDY